MHPYQYARSKDRETVNFYERIRLQQADFELLDQEDEQANNDELLELASIPYDKIYGKIIKEDFERILDSYGTQQTSKDLAEKPVACDTVDGGNYAKLLYSRPGFHHLGSTAYLIKDLDLENVRTNSFLGGHNSYMLHENESILALRRLYDMADVRRSIELVIKLIEKDELQQAKHELDKISKTNSTNGDFLAARGLYYQKVGRYTDAAKDLVEALKSNPTDQDTTRALLSTCLYEHGCSLYHRNDWKNALRVLTDSFHYNGRNNGAKMMIGMCESKLASSQGSFTPKPAYRR